MLLRVDGATIEMSGIKPCAHGHDFKPAPRMDGMRFEAALQKPGPEPKPLRPHRENHCNYKDHQKYEKHYRAIAEYKENQSKVLNQASHVLLKRAKEITNKEEIKSLKLEADKLSKQSLKILAEANIFLDQANLEKKYYDDEWWAHGFHFFNHPERD